MNPDVDTSPLKVERVSQFLPRHERDILYDAMRANQEVFRRPGHFGADVKGTLRWNLDVDWEDCDSTLKDTVNMFSIRVQERLPSLFSEVGVAPFPKPELPWGFVNCTGGHTAATHNDSVFGKFKITVLYYFYRTPKAFRGGTLQFFKTDDSSSTGYGEKAIASFDPEDNQLFAFPSEINHGVPTIESDSDDFAAGRFLAVSFIGLESP